MPGIRYLPAVLVILSIAGLATEHLFHYPIGIMVLLGVYDIWRKPREILFSVDARLYSSLFVCVWIPMLLALPDAADPARAVKTTLLYLHFLPAGLYIVYAMADATVRRIVMAGIAFVVAFWCIDAVIQLLSGRDLFGYPYDDAVLKGMFYPKQRFGLVLAVFTPLYLHVVHRLAVRSAWAWLLLLPLVVAVMFSLKRTAWVMLAVALAAYAACLFRPARHNVRSTIAAAVLVAAALVATTVFVPNINTHIGASMKVFSSDFAEADRATSYRLSLWKTGLSAAREHWLNGVGPRGYRSVYRDFAARDDFWTAGGRKGQTHPHLMALEVLVETGIIGLIAYALVLFALVRTLWRQRLREPASAVYLMVAFVAWFPLNAHMAFYGSYWSSIAWLMIALGCAGAGRDGDRLGFGRS